MKQGTVHHMKVYFEGLTAANIASIEFVFSQKKDGKPLKTASYTAGAAEPDVELVDGLFLVPWTREETYLFRRDDTFYMDTRVYMTNSDDNPQTEVVPLRMNATLFEPIDEEVGAEATALLLESMDFNVSKSTNEDVSFDRTIGETTITETVPQPQIHGTRDRAIVCDVSNYYLNNARVVAKYWEPTRADGADHLVVGTTGAVKDAVVVAVGDALLQVRRHAQNAPQRVAAADHLIAVGIGDQDGPGLVFDAKAFLLSFIVKTVCSVRPRGLPLLGHHSCVLHVVVAHVTHDGPIPRPVDIGLGDLDFVVVCILRLVAAEAPEFHILVGALTGIEVRGLHQQRRRVHTHVDGAVLTHINGDHVTVQNTDLDHASASSSTVSNSVRSIRSGTTGVCGLSPG